MPAVTSLFPRKILSHGGPVWSVTFSSDGSRLATSSEDRTAKLWESRTGRLIRTLEGHSAAVTSAVFTPDGTKLLTLGEPTSLRAWDAATGQAKEIRRTDRTICSTLACSPRGEILAAGSPDPAVWLLNARTGAYMDQMGSGGSHHADMVISLAFSPDGAILASGSRDNTIMLWRTKDDVLLQRLAAQRGEITSVAFASDGRTIASASDDGTVDLWKVQNGKLLRTLDGMGAVAFSNDGKLLATGSQDGKVRLWDPLTGALKAVLRGHSARINALSFSPGGDRLASGSSDRTARLWDLRSFQRAADVLTKRGAVPGWAPELELELGHHGVLTSGVFSPDGQTLISGSEDHTVKLWDLRTGLEKATLKGHTSGITEVAISANGKILATNADQGQVQFWNPETGAHLWSLEDSALSMALSPDGRSLVIGSRDHKIRRWDLDRGACVVSMEGHTGYVEAVTYSPDGKLLASGGADSAIRLWNPGSGEILRTLTWPHQEKVDKVHAVAFSANGKLLASAHQSGAARIWDVKTGKLLETLQAAAELFSVTFSPDSNTVMAGTIVPMLYSWDTQSGKLLKTQLGSTTLSPDGRITATRSGSRIVLRDLHTGSVLRTLGCSAGVEALAASPDGTTLAVGCEKTIQLWDLRTGEIHRSVTGHMGGILALAFSPDGASLASASHDCTVKLWNLQTGQLRQTIPAFRQDPDRPTLSFSPDGKILAISACGQPIQRVDLHAGKLFPPWDGIDQKECRACFSPHGGWLVTRRSEDLLFRNAQTGALLKTIHAPRDGFAYALSSNARMLAAEGDWHLRLWNLETGRLTGQLYNSVTYSAAFSPDGKTVVAGNEQGELRAWDAQTDIKIWETSAHASWVTSLAFLPDGKRLVSGSLDGTVRLWDSCNGRLIATLVALAGKHDWLAATPEGYLNYSGQASRVVAWKVSGKLLPAECYLRQFCRPDVVRKSLQVEALDRPGFEPPEFNSSVTPAAHFVSLKDAGSKPGTAVVFALDTYGRHDVREVSLFLNGHPLPPSLVKPMSAHSIRVQEAAQAIGNEGKPILIGAKPILLSARPILVGEKPILVGAKPMESSDALLAVATSSPAVLGSPYVSSYQALKRFVFRISLPSGAGVIHLKAVAYDTQGLGSPPAEILLQRDSQPAPGVLYVLCVGISRYKNGSDRSSVLNSDSAASLLPNSGDSLSSTHPRSHTAAPAIPVTHTTFQTFPNLRFPASDALAMAARWQIEARPLYSRVEVHTLVNEQATLINLRHEIHWLQQQVRPGGVDTVVVFLSGHGIADKEGHYTFPTYEFNPDQIAHSSVSGQQIQQLLGPKLDARSVFLLVDTCYSGALAGDANDRLDLDFARSGIYLLASSGAARYSYESSRWGHGLLTEALLHCLSQSKLARNGVIHFDDLANGVTQEMAVLAGSVSSRLSIVGPVVPLEGHPLGAVVALPRPLLNRELSPLTAVQTRSTAAGINDGEVGGGIGSLRERPAAVRSGFRAAGKYEVGRGPDSIAVGDFDGDGAPDLAVANDSSGAVHILFNNGDGTFNEDRPAAVIQVGGELQSVVAADLNGDGALDLAVSAYETGALSIFFGDGHGSFREAATYPAKSLCQIVAVDLNGDGHPDLASVSYSAGAIFVWLNKGNGAFQEARLYSTLGAGPYSLAAGDFNGDGRIDLVAANRESCNVSILINTGAGTFHPALLYPTGVGPQSIAVADFNGDGKTDLVTGNTTSNNIAVLMGCGDGTFSPPAFFPVGWAPRYLAVGDLDGDGKADVVTADQGSSAVSVLVGRGDGAFRPAAQFASGVLAWFPAIADLDRDGRPDLVVANYGNLSYVGTISVLLNSLPGTSKGQRSTEARTS